MKNPCNLVCHRLKGEFEPHFLGNCQIHSSKSTHISSHIEFSLSSSYEIAYIKFSSSPFTYIYSAKRDFATFMNKNKPTNFGKLKN